MRDTKFMTASEKERVLKQWETFLEHGCQAQHFTQSLYHHLIQHCSFIAHYDRGGFYSTYFESGENTAHFLTQFDKTKGCVSVEYGMTYWLTGEDYQDINNAMVDVAGKYIPILTSQANKRQRQADIRQASVLLAKHSIKLEVKL